MTRLTTKSGSVFTGKSITEVVEKWNKAKTQFADYRSCQIESIEETEQYTMEEFIEDIERMNAMYELGHSDVPVMMTKERIEAFHSILREEADELGDVESIADVADLLGDVVVFCFSEARKHGLNIDKHLQIIMQSNFSKLGADGKPIKDERGKFLKGPNYWRPEPKIAQEIEEAMQCPAT